MTERVTTHPVPDSIRMQTDTSGRRNRMPRSIRTEKKWTPPGSGHQISLFSCFAPPTKSEQIAVGTGAEQCQYKDAVVEVINKKQVGADMTFMKPGITA